MTITLPDARNWGLSDSERLAKLAAGTAQSGLMRSEPENQGIAVEKAFSVLESLAEEDEDVSEILPNSLCFRTTG